jgi:phenylacetate-CoA ligase
VLHVIESAYYAEVLGPDDEPVLPGQTGELVLTTLGRIGSPTLRYRTGDLVKPAAEPGPCRCGRHELALEGGILGRTDDMVVVRGVNVFPSAVEEIVRACGGVAEYRVEISTVRTLPELSLQIEPEPGCADTAGLVDKLEKSFDHALSLRVPITLVPAGTLPRFEMKGKRWVKVQGNSEIRSPKPEGNL